MTTASLSIPLVVVALLIAGCGGGSDSPSAPTYKIGPTRLVANTEGPGPVVPIPKGPPPKKKLIIVNLRKGSGAKAKVGDDATVRYVGIRWNGELQSNSWTYPQPPTFELGTIEASERGLDEGIRGMQVGGRREIVIPASRRFYSKIEQSGDEAIVFVVDLVRID